MPMSRAPQQLLSGWVAHPRPIGFPEMNFGRALKKARTRNDLPNVFAMWSAIARDRSGRRLLTHSTPTPSHSTPSPPVRRSTSLLPTPAPLSPATRTFPLPTLSRLGTRPLPKRNTPKRTPPTAPLGMVPAPAAPTLHLSSTIFRKHKESRSTTEEEYSENCSSYLWLLRTRMQVLRRQDLL